MPVKVAINGAAGRMGRRLVDLGCQDPDLEVCAALEHAEHPDLGKDAGAICGIGEIAVPLSAEVSPHVEAVIDFSVPPAAEAITEVCRDQRIPLVIATTGLSDLQQQLIRDTAQKIPIVWAPSMSMAVNLTMKLSEIAAETLNDAPGGADVEIIERHHRFKQDAPSGTALRFGQLIAEKMHQKNHVHGREGQTGERAHEEIGYHALRVGDNPGEHTIVFGVLGETIELTVKATNRDSYALGALLAAKFVSHQKPGLYTMYDVLGL